MKKTVYFIPGFGETCGEHQLFLDAINARGYRVLEINPNWVKPISKQVFRIENDSIVIGYSYGALLAYLIVKKFPCWKVIFASISPVDSFTYGETYTYHKKYMTASQAQKTAHDIVSIKIDLKSLKTPHAALAGEKEKMNADYIVPKTGHMLTKKYISAILKLIDKKINEPKK